MAGDKGNVRLLVAAAIGAPQIVIYLHASSTTTHTAISRAISERQPAEIARILVTTHDAGFVAGESSAVVSALSGGRAAPVRRTPRGSRSSSSPPSSRSSARICWESDGWETSSRSAAAVSYPLSAMAMKYSSWRRCMT